MRRNLHLELASEVAAQNSAVHCESARPREREPNKSLAPLPTIPYIQSNAFSYFDCSNSSNAARSDRTTKLTRRRKPEVKRGTSETQGCRRSGAAPCSVAVMDVWLHLFGILRVPCPCISLLFGGISMSLFLWASDLANDCLQHEGILHLRSFSNWKEITSATIY